MNVAKTLLKSTLIPRCFDFWNSCMHGISNKGVCNNMTKFICESLCVPVMLFLCHTCNGGHIIILSLHASICLFNQS